MLISFTLPVPHDTDDLERAIRKKCGKKIKQYRIVKQSLDARRATVRYAYTVEVSTNGAPLPEPKRLEIAKCQSAKRPIVVGFGPCGMFAALILAKAGLRPIVLERGDNVETRTAKVERFWQSGTLDTDCNVQFGEGGAGTFSDGKLTTLINDPLCKEVLETFIDCGAEEQIRYVGKPHLGTDHLKTIVVRLRQQIESLGGEIKFGCTVRKINTQNGNIVSVTADREYETDRVILAIGHSARDTFVMLQGMGLAMCAKSFSVGTRIEHPQQLINQSQYGDAARFLPPADYKLSYHTQGGRGVYTFCMCPGGVVVGAASEQGRVVTNGMSYHDRDGENANAAFLVGVTPEDYGSTDSLAGMYFQQRLEEKAFLTGGGNYRAPAQRLEDFVSARPSVGFGAVKPTYLPGVTPCDLNAVLPDYVTSAMREAVPYFARRLKGFDLSDAVLTGVETRSSSPVRLLRGENKQSDIVGLYPAGEGAGYAGGIMSAAVDGIKIALAIINELQ